MPLSEDEERILSEIERELYQSDPGLVQAVGQTTIYSHALRNLKWAVLGMVLGLVILVASLSTSFVLSFLGFLVMLAAAVVAEGNARKMGKVGIQQVADQFRASGLRDYFGADGARPRRDRED